MEPVGLYPRLRAGYMPRGWKSLEDRERFILLRRARRMTLSAIATEEGISRERVRQIERAALEKLVQWQS